MFFSPSLLFYFSFLLPAFLFHLVWRLMRCIQNLPRITFERWLRFGIEQLTSGSANLSSVHCWAATVNMVVVEYFMESSSYSVPDSLLANNISTTPSDEFIRFGRIFDLEDWNTFSRSKCYAPLVQWELFPPSLLPPSLPLSLSLSLTDWKRSRCVLRSLPQCVEHIPTVCSERPPQPVEKLPAVCGKVPMLSSSCCIREQFCCLRRTFPQCADNLPMSAAPQGASLLSALCAYFLATIPIPGPLCHHTCRTLPALPVYHDLEIPTRSDWETRIGPAICTQFNSYYDSFWN